MKRVYGLLAALIIGATAMAQATAHEKEVVRNDIARERNKRHEVARDILTGQPERARADHRAAVAYHERTHRDIRQVHHNSVRRARYHPHYVRRHHYRHYRHHRPIRHHARVVVEVRH